MAITNLNPTTELEAVNSMLNSIGEAPVSDLTVVLQQDVAVAISLLTDATRDVQTLGWRFNTEFELALTAASANFAWTDHDGTARTLRIFTRPTNLAKFELSATADQAELDVTLRPAKLYEPATSPLVFYDRARNRDGFIATERTYLFIDAVWLFPFEKMPESARRYVVLRAARQLQQKILASSELAGFTAADEAQAFRTLKLDQGDNDNYNMFQSADVSRVLGGRTGLSGVSTPRRRWR